MASVEVELLGGQVVSLIILALVLLSEEYLVRSLVLLWVGLVVLGLAARDSPRVEVRLEGLDVRVLVDWVSDKV